MNKTAIKNFAIWARNKLIADIHYRAGLLGITAEGIANPLPQSTGDTEFYDIGTAEPYSIHGQAVKQRKRLVELLNKKADESDYAMAYKYVLEEVAYTWFNRLIAVRFMEVNDYLPSHIRVLSSESGKMEPDLVTTPFDANLEFTEAERALVIQMKQDNQLDELFRLLFIKECNALNEILPALFEKTNDYTELLLSISVVDKEGVVYRLVNDIPEENFDVEKGGQVEIIGWLYQYYNTEPKAEVFGRPSGTKIKKEDIPAATQLFTPDWIVRYMVENSLGRLWVEGHPEQKDNFLPSEAEQTAYREDHSIQDGKWHYYLEEAEQEPEVQDQLAEIRKEYANLNPEDIRCIDPCMGSGHILVYLFDVLMQIYEAQGYTRRDAAQSILINNLYGLDIDDRAAQMAYFAVMMKARQYDRRILTRGIVPHVYTIQESNGINRAQLDYFGDSLNETEKNTARIQMEKLLDTLVDAKEYGSILQVENCDWDLLLRFVDDASMREQISMNTLHLDDTQIRLRELVEIGQCLAQKYDVVVTNPPYMGSSGMSGKLSNYVKKNYPDSKSDLFAVFIESCGYMVKENMYQAMITQHAWMFLSSFQKLREKLQYKDTVNMTHLGARAFEEIGGEVVQTTAFVLRNSNIARYKGKYCRLIEATTQQEKEGIYLSGNNRYEAQQLNFSKIPGSPIAYWVGKAIFHIFGNDVLDNYYSIKAGICTGENAVFILEWYEINFTKSSMYDHFNYLYSAHNKGGEYRKWYGNRELVLKYNEDALKKMEMREGFRHDGKEFYFREHIGWSKITSGKSSFRYFEEGFTFDSAGLGLFPKAAQNIFLTLGFLNSCVAEKLIALLNPTLNVTPMVVKKLPFTNMEYVEVVEPCVKNCIDICKTDWDSFEISWDFKKHPLVAGRLPEPVWGDVSDEMAFANTSLSYTYHMFWENQCNYRFEKLKRNEEELNRIFIDIYGLQEELTPEVEDKDVTVRKADLSRDIRSLISYAVGCMFGRYSLDVEGLAYAGGDWDSSKYTTYIPDADNILPITDEEYFKDDIVGMFCAWVKKVYGPDTLEENLDFIAKALGNKGNSSREVIRNYFLKDFFKDHCKTYQKRPIYWLFDSGKQNGFKALVYLHRYNADTIGNLRVDYLHRMQRIYESEINRMQDMIDNSTNAREVAASTKRKDKLQKQLKECREYDEKIGHLALSRIELDLDDGVKVNYRKAQTARDGKFYEVLADSKNIMGK
ncbi:BREX-1 system adenine-specific DNA-methyltransferase PglX [Blautia sp. An46]|uniref:BREX-1 system adenine-specific DNA-methyltransferase PglX n=1 Tax=Blautia sp. An46 TaxID=1965636 RepID=UPI000B39B56B|nr:BREX-1 system adenine-specific DNA-methyltransferase PglX [Blautia sp. An46]OUN91169.1 restriction endonuclease [Blautia sp. An46]